MLDGPRERWYKGAVEEEDWRWKKREVGWERAGDGVEEEEYLEEDDDYEEEEEKEEDDDDGVYRPYKLSLYP